MGALTVFSTIFLVLAMGAEFYALLTENIYVLEALNMRVLSFGIYKRCSYDSCWYWNFNADKTEYKAAAIIGILSGLTSLIALIIQFVKCCQQNSRSIYNTLSALLLFNWFFIDAIIGIIVTDYIENLVSTFTFLSYGFWVLCAASGLNLLAFILAAVDKPKQEGGFIISSAPVYPNQAFRY